MTQHHVSLQHLTKQQFSQYQQNENEIGIPDISRAVAQYDNLCKTISNLGATLSLLPCPQREIGSLAVIAGRMAILGRTNNTTEQTAYSTIASVFAGNSILKFIEDSGTLDGKDVVRIDNLFLIAVTERTNYEGVAQLGVYLKDAGYDVEIVDAMPEKEMRLQEHLIYLGNNTIAVSPIMEKHYSVLEYKKVVLEQATKIIPNSLWLNNTLIMPAGFAKQEQQLQSFGVPIHPVNLSEFAKLGITLNSICLSTQQDTNQDIGEIASYLTNKKLFKT